MKNCTHRKREYRIHEILSNGQHFNLYFKKHHCKPAHPYIHGIWKIGLVVSLTRKEANMWYAGKDKKYHLKQTGTCGLETLIKAKNYIIEFASMLSPSSEIQIAWEDEKRKRVYSRLTKYGFVENEDCYSFRNPEYWSYKEEGERNG